VAAAAGSRDGVRSTSTTIVTARPPAPHLFGSVSPPRRYYAHRAFGTMHPENRSFCDLMASTAAGGVEVGACHVGVYSTDLYTDRLVSVVREHAASDEDSERARPLFLYAAYQAVHGPMDEPPETSAYSPEQMAMMERVRNSSDAWRAREKFAKITMSLDRAVLRLAKELDDVGYLSNTVIALASDNGACPSEGGNNWPLRGTKFEQFEGGVRVPAFIWSVVVVVARTRAAAFFCSPSFYVARPANYAIFTVGSRWGRNTCVPSR
jgi:hypothetical protein